MADYNCITVQDVTNEIGMKGYRELRRVIKWLENPSGQWNTGKALRNPIGKRYRFRFAPSIISRCEAEVFNLSIPRFAIRVYQDRPADLAPHNNPGGQESQLGYINLRRVETFRKYAKSWSGTYNVTNELPLHKEYFVSEPSRVLEQLDKDNRISRIGDCLLVPPAWTSSFHIVQSFLGHILGEVPQDANDIKGVPYMKHIVLVGGGLCAQAACFIATTLMHEYALGVHGILDITRLARKQSGNMLSLHGLNKWEMSRYFSHKKVRLRGEWEVFVNWSSDAKDSQAFSRTVQSYLLSDIPIIYPIDMGRSIGIRKPTSPPLNHQSIFESNGFKRPKLEVKRRNHAVILIGCGTEDTTDGKVLYHDTAIRPFMRATFDQLLDARCYTNKQMEKLREACILPVTPSRVRLHLNFWQQWDQAGGSYRLHPGLIELSSRLQSGCYGEKLPYYSGRSYDPGVFGLVRLKWPLCDEHEDVRMRRVLESMLGEEGTTAYKSFIDYLSTSHSAIQLDRWIWVQYQSNTYDPIRKRNLGTLWFWDAERSWHSRDNTDGNDMHSVENIKSFLLGLFVESKTGQWQPIDNHCQFDKIDLQLRISLISSFSTNGMENTIRNWPKADTPIYCDLYTVMQEDATAYRHRYGIPQDVNSRGLFARLQGDYKAAKQIAKEVGPAFKKKEITLRALASFLPGLASKSQKNAEEAQKALIFLLDLSDALNADYGHDIHALEFVAGSMVEGALPILTQDGREFFAACMETVSSDAIKRLVERLGPVAKEARRRGIFLALEMEPGANFLVKDWEAMVIFCQALENASGEYAYDLSANVGLNLDIAHWNLAGIEASNIAETSTKDGSNLIRKYIVHCHISDHGRGHFADLAIGTVNSEQYFKNWLKVIKSLDNNKFSRTVALELEACKNSGHIQSSLSILNDILFDISGYPKESRPPHRPKHWWKRLSDILPIRIVEHRERRRRTRTRVVSE